MNPVVCGGLLGNPILVGEYLAQEYFYRCNNLSVKDHNLIEGGVMSNFRSISNIKFEKEVVELEIKKN